MAESPVKQQAALMYTEGLSRPGVLLLYPDKIAHVATKAAVAGVFGGLIGSLIGEGIAKAKARKRVAEGGDGVVQIPLAAIAELRRGREGFNKKVLELALAGGDLYRFSARFDRWAPKIAESARSAGADVHPSDGGSSFTWPPSGGTRP